MWPCQLLASASTRVSTVNTYKKIIANPQIFMSRAGFKNFFMVNASASASPRSWLMRRTIHSHSAWFRNPQDLDARSGKSTKKTMQSSPTKPVI